MNALDLCRPSRMAPLVALVVFAAASAHAAESDGAKGAENAETPSVARAQPAAAEQSSRLEALISRYEQAYPDAARDEPERAGDVERASLIAQIVQMFAVLGGVCLLAYLVLGKLLPRLVRGTTPLAQRHILEVVDRLPIDQRRSILVIEMATRYFLVGITEQGITLLSRLEEDEVKAALLRAKEKSKTTTFGGLASMLSRLAHRGG